MKRFVTACLVPLIQALAPPHPDLLRDYTNFVPHGRHLKIHSKTRLLHPELCRHMTDEACEDMDQGFQEQASRLRRVMETTGTIKTLVLLVQFTDHADRDLPTVDEIHQVLHGIETNDIIPAGSAGEFLRINSYDNFLWETDILNWTLTDNTQFYYSFNISGLTMELGRNLHPIFEYWEEQGHDFTQYDQDGDGVIDSLVFLHSGYPAEIGGLDCYSGDEYPTRIWSHAIGPNDAAWVSSTSNIRSGGYMATSALTGVCDNIPTRIGVLTHEFLHTLALPDLYDSGGDWIGEGIGTFDIMSNPYGIYGDSIFPNNLGPWCRIQLNWLEPTPITTDGLYTIEASALAPQVYKIDHGFHSEQYLLIENRQPLRFDQLLWDGGLLIWQIDDAAPLQGLRGYPGQEGWPLNGNHYQVAVVQADGNYDLEIGINYGDEGDFFVQGSSLEPHPIEVGSTTADYYPNSNSYWVGNGRKTGVRIHDISISDTVMTFRVSGISSAISNSSSSIAPTNLTTIAPTSNSPSESPKLPPTISPTHVPTAFPTIDATTVSSTPTVAPLADASSSPTSRPTSKPSTLTPTAPTSPRPSWTPMDQSSQSPTLSSLTDSPFSTPVSSKPPTVPSKSPIPRPTVGASHKPSTSPVSIASLPSGANVTLEITPVPTSPPTRFWPAPSKSGDEKSSNASHLSCMMSTWIILTSVVFLVDG